jgi:hypothetical protein
MMKLSAVDLRISAQASVWAGLNSLPLNGENVPSEGI